MTSAKIENESVRLRPWLPFAAFFLVSCLYLQQCVEPELICHMQGRAVLADRAVLQGAVRHPGGLLDYAVQGLVQFCYWPVLGSLVLGLLFSATAGFGEVSLRRCSRYRLPWLSLIPGIFLLALYSRYTYPLTTVLDAAFLLAACALYQWIPLRNAAGRLVLFVLFASVVYYVAGGPVLCFAVLCAVVEWLAGRRLLGLACIAIAAALPLAASRLLADVLVREAYAWPWPRLFGRSIQSLTAALFAYYPVVGIGLALCARLRGSKAAAETPRGVVRPALPWPVLVVAAAVALYFAFDRDGKFLARVDYCAEHRQWSEVLHEVRSRQTNPVFAMQPAELGKAVLLIHNVNRALYHEGRLAYDMFSYPQVAGMPTLMLSDKEYCYQNPRSFLERANLFLDLGRVNEAEHMTHETWATFGDYPAVFEDLALINIVKGRADAARNILTAFRRSPLHTGWADKYLRELDADPQLGSNPYVAWLRSATYDSDVAGPTAYGQDEQMLLRLLITNKQNRMAFEYLMAHYLLNRQPDKIIENLALLDGFDYPGIPRHYEEAILQYMNDARVRNPNLGGRTLSPETVQRFREFRRIAALAGRDTAGLWDAFYATYGNTYWFYNLFSVTGFGKETAANRPDAFAGEPLP